MKKYYIQRGIGKVKYIVNFHDGEKKHKDGSEFFDVATFKNKKEMNVYIELLKLSNYKLI